MELRIMSAKPKNLMETHPGTGDKNLSRHTGLIVNMTWVGLIFTFVTALALWMVGAPLPVILLLAPLVLAGIVILMATRSLRVDLKSAQQAIRSLLEHNHSLEKARIELELSAAIERNDLEHRADLSQATVEVMGSINSKILRSTNDLDQGLAECATLISERFDYSVVNIFMLETDIGQASDTAGDAKYGQRLRLRAANTQTGRQLIEQGYTLTLDQINSVTSAARLLTPIFAGEVQTVPPYLEDVDSPINQSEVALPLMIGKRLLGVLDLQGSMTSTLRREDLGVLQTLANQLSVAIENTIFLVSNQKNPQSLEQANENLSLVAKKNFLRKQPDRGFRAGSSGEPIAVNDSWNPLMIEARESGEIVFDNPVADAFTVAVPVKIRNEVAGVIRLRKPLEGSKWRPEEVALVQRLSDRLSAAVESARLFGETRRAAEREHLTGEITARMRSTNDPQAVLQIAARELRKALRADKAQLLVQTAVSHPPKVDEVDADNQAGDQP